MSTHLPTQFAYKLACLNVEGSRPSLAECGYAHATQRGILQGVLPQYKCHGMKKNLMFGGLLSVTFTENFGRAARQGRLAPAIGEGRAYFFFPILSGSPLPWRTIA